MDGERGLRMVRTMVRTQEHLNETFAKLAVCLKHPLILKKPNRNNGIALSLTH